MSSFKRAHENSTSELWQDKLFADLLQSVHLRSSIYSRAELTAPWGFSINDQGTVFHIVAQGNCWLEAQGTAMAVELSAGDFVVVPRGGVHILRDSEATPVIDLAKCFAADEKGVFRAGGAGPITRLVCGGMQFENATTDPFLAILPSLIHIKGKARGGIAWLQPTVTQILEELDSDRAGAQAVVTRLAEILFIQAVRTYLEQNRDTAEHGWLAALREPHIGPSLALLHANPQKPWTVASLAHVVGTSRSLFAARFAQLVGVSPMRYVKRLRLNAAVLRLRSTDDKLSAIAADAGYESAAAFTKAFKRHFGKTPGEYRRSALVQAAPPDVTRGG